MTDRISPIRDAFIARCNAVGFYPKVVQAPSFVDDGYAYTVITTRFRLTDRTLEEQQDILIRNMMKTGMKFAIYSITVSDDTACYRYAPIDYHIGDNYPCDTRLRLSDAGFNVKMVQHTEGSDAEGNYFATSVYQFPTQQDLIDYLHEKGAKTILWHSRTATYYRFAMRRA